MVDGHVLDPDRPESLVYGFDAAGRAYLLGAMFLDDSRSASPPQPGGCLTTWHTHTNLCLAPGKGMVGVVGPDGTCPPGSANTETAAMLHVWAMDLPTGPFSELAELDPATIRSAVVASGITAG
jgi:hypothetical protein